MAVRLAVQVQVLYWVPYLLWALLRWIVDFAVINFVLDAILVFLLVPERFSRIIFSIVRVHGLG